jgi:hypothetical protein
MKLPSMFLEANVDGVKGGVEYGFMSTVRRDPRSRARSLSLSLTLTLSRSLLLSLFPSLSRSLCLSLSLSLSLLLSLSLSLSRVWLHFHGALGRALRTWSGALARNSIVNSTANSIL